MAVKLPPVDETVKIPEAVKRAAAAAEAFYGKVPEPTPAPPPPAPPAPPAPPPPASDAPPAPPPALPPPVPEPDVQRQDSEGPQPLSPPVDPDNWQHRYHSMKGRFDQAQTTMGGMQEQISELSQELNRMQQLITRPPRPAPNAKLITPEEEKLYGAELIDLTKRAAQEALGPTITALQQERQEAAQREAQRAARDIHASLSREVPNWRAINTSPEFLAWLRLPDLYSGMVRGQLLRNAFSAADAPRVAVFFKNYLAEAQATGQLPAPQQPAANPAPRPAAVPLDTLVAPGAVRPASGTPQTPVDEPVFTLRQIRDFYSNEGRARYIGREADRTADEQLIFAAQKAGRVRG